MKLSVLYGCDDNYAPHTGISMTSLFENNRDIDEITVYLAAMDYSRENIDRMRRLASQYNRKLVMLDTEVPKQKIEQSNCGKWNGSIAAWLRFFVLDQIPEDVDRLLWIDSDTIVEKGLGHILQTDMTDKPIAAICDCISYRARFYLGFGIDEPYYNSGVILFNMSYIRQRGVLPRMMRHIADNAAGYLTPDQDMMNVFFRGEIIKLPPQYNYQCFLSAYSIEDFFSVYPWSKEAYYTPEQIQEAKRAPVINHFFRFLGDYPWQRGRNYHPAKALYEEWIQKSLWKDHPGVEARTELSFRVEKLLYRLLPRKFFLKVFSWYTNRNYPKPTVKQGR